MFFDRDTPYIIAELSGNHNGSIESAKAIITAAAANGADCVKLQTYTADTMTIKSDLPDFQINSGLWAGRNLYDLYDWAHTPYEWHAELFAHANDLGITCISTPFDETAVDLLEDLNAPFYKIASFEVTDLPLIGRVASTGKPMIMSTGMCDLDDVAVAVAHARQSGCEHLVLLHCISSYPAPIDQANLQNIDILRQKFGCEVGLSDHTIGNIVALASVARGVKVIEKHLTLDRSAGGPDAAFSMEPADLQSLRADVDAVCSALGQGFVRPNAEDENKRFRRSVYVVEDVRKGEVITEDNVRRIRPGFGLHPKFLDEIIGEQFAEDVARGTPLHEDHILGWNNNG